MVVVGEFVVVVVAQVVVVLEFVMMVEGHVVLVGEFVGHKCKRCSRFWICQNIFNLFPNFSCISYIRHRIFC